MNDEQWSGLREYEVDYPIGERRHVSLFRFSTELSGTEAFDQNVTKAEAEARTRTFYTVKTLRMLPNEYGFERTLDFSEVPAMVR